MLATHPSNPPIYSEPFPATAKNCVKSELHRFRLYPLKHKDAKHFHKNDLKGYNRKGLSKIASAFRSRLLVSTQPYLKPPLGPGGSEESCETIPDLTRF